MTEAKRVRAQRKKTKAKGLAAFLGRVTGMDIVIRKIQRVKDKRRFAMYQSEKQKLVERQIRGMGHLRERHRMQMLDIKRHVRAVNKIEKREMKSKETERIKTARIRHRTRKDIEHMPAIDMKRYEAVRAKVKPVERKVEKEERKRESKTLDQWRGGWLRLSDLFSRASEGESEDGKGEKDSSGALQPSKPRKTPNPEQRRNRNRDNDPGR